MAENRGDLSQLFLDKIYTKETISKYEWISGRGWVTQGGELTIKNHLLKLKLQPENRVLDIGCGPGGSSFSMARSSGAHVHGVDISSNMIDVARERLASEDEEVRDKIQFEQADITDANYASNSYDVIYSRLTILFIADKENLYRKIYQWLKPGGTLFIEDICIGDQEHHSKGFLELIKKRRYHLRTLKDHSKLIKETGFRSVQTTNETSNQVHCIERELKQLENSRETFLKEYSEDDYKCLVHAWRDRIDWYQGGELVWVLCQAKK